MRLLILGGTVYLGRALVEAARARGHRVTLFNRGIANPDLFPDLERLRGDREGDLAALRGKRWDAVIDTSGYLPRTVRASAEALGEAVEHYTFVSSISVYADNTRRGIIETDPVARLAPGTPEVLSAETYGALKARCEEEAEAILPSRVLTVRAGLIFGPHDTSERSAYWPARVARGGEVLAPGRPERPIQLVDVRDLAEWILEMSAARRTGVYNATGPDRTLTMREFLDTCRAVSGSDARWAWVDEAFLASHAVVAYNELPLWVPERYHAFETVNCTRARSAGLRFRPLEESLRDVLDFERVQGPGPRVPKVGMPPPPALALQREAELLRVWQERSRS